MRLRTTAVFALASVLALGGCTGGGLGIEEPDPTATIAPELVVPAGEAAFDQPVTVEVQDGTIEAATVTSDEGEPLSGDVADDGSSWVSSAVPVPGATYSVSADVADEVGDPVTLTADFVVAAVPDANRLTLTLQPGDGDVVGVGAPVIVRFDQEVTEQADVEAAMHVSSQPQVVGAWRWLSSTEAHFRPQEYWPAGTQVGVDLDLNGVQAGDDLWGGRAYTFRFTIGNAQVASVDAAAHTMTVTVDGAPVGTWDASLGRPEFATRNGTYIVLEKDEKHRMTSCSVEITCDESDPEYYDLEVDWNVRLTWSGAFVHSAPWSETAQGSENVSHGCVNLSERNARSYFDMARYGDVVTVQNSTRGPEDLVARGDPGMADWNLTWSEYVAGSALGQQVTTEPLGG
ncbi:MAG: Ig-like domain-containing protein [Jiangellaceae bacterium]